MIREQRKETRESIEKKHVETETRINNIVPHAPEFTQETKIILQARDVEATNKKTKKPQSLWKGWCIRNC